jgi:hypothetical protein
MSVDTMKSSISRKPVIHYTPEQEQIRRELQQAAKTYHPPGRAFTEFDDDAIREFYGNVPHHFLETKLHRTKESIQMRAHKLGVHVRKNRD